MRCTITRRLLIVAIACVPLLVPAAPARAAIWSGACAVDVTFDFSSPVRSAVSTISRPSYTIQGSGSPCAVTLDLGDPLRTTAFTGSGTADAWTCEAASGSGTWSQSFNPDPPSVLGSHRVDGAWGEWTLVVQDSALTFLGVAELTVHPDDADALARCLSGGLTSLRTTGVMAFQDP